MTLVTNVNSPREKAINAAAVELKGPSKGRSPLHAYVAERLRGSLDDLNGAGHRVALAYSDGKYNLTIISPSGIQNRFAEPALSDVVRHVNEVYFSEKGSMYLKLDLNEAHEDIHALRKQISSVPEERTSEGGIILPASSGSKRR